MCIRDRAGNQGITKFRGAFRDQVEKSEEWMVGQAWCCICPKKHATDTIIIVYHESLQFLLCFEGAHRKCRQRNRERDIGEVIAQYGATSLSFLMIE